MVQVDRPGSGLELTSGHRPYRIALVSASFHPYAGGVEEHTRQVAHSLSQRGHEVEVWTVDRGERLGSRVVDGLLVRYLPTPLPARSATAMVRFAAQAPLAAARWWRAHRRFDPDLLQVHCFGPNGVYADRLARATRTPLVVSSHGETFMDDQNIFERSALMNASLRRALQRAAAVTACSQSALDDLRTRFGLAAGTVVWNGVDLSYGAVRGDREGPPVVFAVGRVERMKGFDLLLEAFARPEVPGDALLVIGGDGSVREELMALAHRLGVAERVSFPGRLTPEEVARRMTDATVVVVPSRREAFGIVALEAWRAGTPLVATSRGGPSEFVRSGIDGLLVDPENAAELAAAIVSVLTDRELARRLADEGLRSVEKFTWSAVTDQYLSLFDEVVA